MERSVSGDSQDAREREIGYILNMKHIDEESNSEAWRTNAILEDMNAKFDAVLEAVKPIPQMQQDIRELKNQGEKVAEDIAVLKASVQINAQEISKVKEIVQEMKPVLDATFDEVGSLREDMEMSKQTLGSHIQKHR